MGPAGRTREGAVSSAAVARRGDRGRARLAPRLDGGLPGSGRVLSTLVRRLSGLSGRGDHRSPRRGPRSERPGRADRHLPRGRSAPGGGKMRAASNDVRSRRVFCAAPGCTACAQIRCWTDEPARPGRRPPLTTVGIGVLSRDLLCRLWNKTAARRPSSPRLSPFGFSSGVFGERPRGRRAGPLLGVSTNAVEAERKNGPRRAFTDQVGRGLRLLIVSCRTRAVRNIVAARGSRTRPRQPDRELSQKVLAPQV